MRTYSELIQLHTFEERFRYLALRGVVGQETFGFDRFINQQFYKSDEWKRVRRQVILRDNGCDLSMDGYTIFGTAIIHHLNPIMMDDIRLWRDALFDPENLVATTLQTHNAIHYGDERLLPKMPIARTPNDTCPWKKR